VPRLSRIRFTRKGDWFVREYVSNLLTEALGAEASAKFKGVSKKELAQVAEREVKGRRWLPVPMKP
jgi:hypothetical protein